MSDPAVADTRRLNSKPQDLTDAYGPPSNFLEIDVFDPQTIGVGRNRFTTYEVRMRTNLPIFKLKDSCVRRRYSDFEWLKNELERDSKDRRPPLGPERTLPAHVPARREHRSELHPRKSTPVGGWASWWGGAGLGQGLLFCSYLSFHSSTVPSRITFIFTLRLYI
uniref:Sorting nexin 12 n=1 Tax=Paramormyrops kingsleyae TaxID=1676925 RepID=A0A3B3Q9L5_9TELE